MSGGIGPSPAASPKSVLRRQVRSRRREHVAWGDRAAEAHAIAEAVADVVSDTVAAAELSARQVTVALYVALPTEPPTDTTISALTARSIRVIVPELLPDNDLDWRAVDGDGRLGPRLGPEAIGEADIVLAPALSVDRGGVRLGQGGGSYDRALARCSPHARVVAVVNDEEYVDGPLPSDPHDAPVDAVITPGLGLVPVGGRAGT